MHWMVFPWYPSPEAASPAACWCRGYTVGGSARFSEVTTCNSSLSLPPLLPPPPPSLLETCSSPNTSDLQIPRGLGQGWGEGKWEKQAYSGVWRVRETRACVRVWVWLECEWAWRGVWEMSMFCTMTTNAPIHYGFTCAAARRALFGAPFTSRSLRLGTYRRRRFCSGIDKPLILYNLTLSTVLTWRGCMCELTCLTMRTAIKQTSCARALWASVWVNAV